MSWCFNCWKSHIRLQGFPTQPQCSLGFHFFYSYDISMYIPWGSFYLFVVLTHMVTVLTLDFTTSYDAYRTLLEFCCLHTPTRDQAGNDFRFEDLIWQRCQNHTLQGVHHHKKPNSQSQTTRQELYLLTISYTPPSHSQDFKPATKEVPRLISVFNQSF